MSARFGRNKRRRAREAIEALAQHTKKLEKRSKQLEAANVMDRGLLRDTTSRLHEALEEIARAKEIAGPYSILFRPEAIKTGQRRPRDTREGRYNVYDPGPLARGPITGPSDSEARMLHTVQSMPLDVFLTSVESDIMTRKCHALLHYLDGTTAYGISTTALMNETTEGVARILRDQLPYMVKQLYDVAKITPRQRRWG